MLRRYGLQRTRLELLDAYAAVVVASRHMAGEYARHVPASKVHVVGLPIESSRPLPPRRSRTIGWRRIVPIAAIAMIAAGVAREWAKRGTPKVDG